MSVRAKAIGSAAAADLQRFALSLWPIRERCRAALVCFGVVLKFVRSLGAGDKCTLASTLWLRVITLARTGSLRATVDTCVGMTAGRLHASSAAAQVLRCAARQVGQFCVKQFLRDCEAKIKALGACDAQMVRDCSIPGACGQNCKFHDFRRLLVNFAC